MDSLLSLDNSNALAWAFRLPLLVGLVWILYKDTTVRRIPNTAVLTVLLLGLGFQIVMPFGAGFLSLNQPGSVGLSTAGIAIAISFGITFFFYALRLWGAGDAKLVIALSASLSWRDLPLFVICVCVCGGVLSLLRMFQQRNARQVFTNLHHITLSAVSGMKSLPLETADRMPFSWAIVGGWLSLFVLKVSQ
jgi:Flp pilus assembly protein protease CpaA